MGRKYKPDNEPPGVRKYWLLESTQTLPFVCSILSSYFCHYTLITAPQLHVSVVSILFFSQQWANSLTTKISVIAAGLSYIHSL